jgi:hypothetical protein
MRNEILLKLKEHQKLGMSIIIPLPKIEIIDWDGASDLQKPIIANV